MSHKHLKTGELEPTAAEIEASVLNLKRKRTSRAKQKRDTKGAKLKKVKMEQSSDADALDPLRDVSGVNDLPADQARRGRPPKSKKREAAEGKDDGEWTPGNSPGPSHVGKAKGRPSSRSASTGKRKKINEAQTLELKKWMVQNWYNPYPTEEEKARLSAELDIPWKQLGIWFMNHRRRWWDPSKEPPKIEGVKPPPKPDFEVGLRGAGRPKVLPGDTNVKSSAAAIIRRAHTRYDPRPTAELADFLSPGETPKIWAKGEHEDENGRWSVTVRGLLQYKRPVRLIRRPRKKEPVRGRYESLDIFHRHFKDDEVVPSPSKSASSSSSSAEPSKSSKSSSSSSSSSADRKWKLPKKQLLYLNRNVRSTLTLAKKALMREKLRSFGQKPVVLMPAAAVLPSTVGARSTSLTLPASGDAREAVVTLSAMDKGGIQLPPVFGSTDAQDYSRHTDEDEKGNKKGRSSTERGSWLQNRRPAESSSVLELPTSPSRQDNLFSSIVLPPPPM